MTPAPFVRRVHHFDDEPELIRWIPNTLYRRYRRHHRDWIVAPNFEERDDRTTFTLHPHGPETQPWKIEYRFYSTTKDFDEHFEEQSQRGDFALMDLMVFNAERQMVPEGQSRFEKARAALGKERVYFLTAYPLELKQATPDEAYLIFKPPNAQRIVDLIIDNLYFKQS